LIPRSRGISVWRINVSTTALVYGTSPSNETQDERANANRFPNEQPPRAIPGTGLDFDEVTNAEGGEGNGGDASW
jgi:hypothetical protein